MATTKQPVPPGNLKDRIAALQQRNAGSSLADSRQSAANGARTTGSLRDKIASFEKQGAVPIPRGSFGLGAPPVDDGSSRRRGELIGNRVPGLSRPVAPVSTPPSRATSPSSPGRMRAASATLQSSPSSRSTSPSFSADGEVDSLYSSPEAALDAAFEELTSPRSTRQSSAWQARRRSVSDIVAKFSVPILAVEPLPEGQEEAEPCPPAIIISQEHTDASAESPTTSQRPQKSHATDWELSDHGASSPASDVINPSSSPDFVDSPGVPLAEEDHIETDHPLPSTTVSQSSADEPQPPVNPDLDEHATVVAAERSDLHVASTSDVSAPAKERLATDAQYQTALAASSSSPMVANNEPMGVSVNTVPYNDVEAEVAKVEMHIDQLPLRSASLSADSRTLSTQQENVVFSSAHTVPLTAQTTVQTKEELTVDAEELGNQSLALDTRDAVIVTDIPRVVTPVMTRATLVPISPISPSPAVETSRECASNFIEPSLTPKTPSGSFRAVVHHKVTEGGKGSISSHMQRVSDLRAAVDSPQSPRFTDLADLLADAALLEQQLTGLGSPGKLSAGGTVPSTPPTTSALRNMSAPRVEVTLSENSHQSDDVSTSGDGDGSSEYNSPQEFPSIPAPRAPSPVTPPQERRRSRMVSDAEPRNPGPVTPAKERPRSRLLSDTPPPVPPKSPRPRYFSTLLSRRPSTVKDTLMPMPGAYPRNSVCSEVSEDDSVLVATPPSPRFDSLGSDTSSVMSSSRSWKMPNKGLARATSFADRLWHKRSNRNTVVIASPGKQHLHVRRSQDSGPYSLSAGYPDDDGHLSVNAAVRPRKSEPTPTLPQLDLSLTSRAERQPSANGDDRPMSWVSVSSSIGSGGLDTALFDAFPSVPDTVPAIDTAPAIPALSLDSDRSSHASSSGFRDSMSSRPGKFPVRSSSLHPKQRSAIL